MPSLLPLEVCVLVSCSPSCLDITVQVLSPLSDSILAEKTVTVLDDKVKKKNVLLYCYGGDGYGRHIEKQNRQIS